MASPADVGSTRESLGLRPKPIKTAASTAEDDFAIDDEGRQSVTAETLWALSKEPGKDDLVPCPNCSKSFKKKGLNGHLAACRPKPPSQATKGVSSWGSAKVLGLRGAYTCAACSRYAFTCFPSFYSDQGVGALL